MNFGLSIVAVFGFISTRVFIQCQSQGTFNPGRKPMAKIAALEREIAKFESQQGHGHAAELTDNRHGHDHERQPTVPQQQPHDSRHMHHVDTVQAPSTGGKTHITDIHGNKPPHPGGFHVDLPGEHGNNLQISVLHHGSEPISPNGGINHAVGGSSDTVGPPPLSDLMPSKGLSIPDGINTGPAIAGVQPMPVPTQSTESGLSIPDGLFSGRGVSIPDGFSSAPVQHQGNQDMHVNLGTHVDGPGEHGNNLPVAVIHRQNQPNNPVEIKHAGVHVDAPGEHGNNLPVAVIHRPQRPAPPTTHLHQGTHVDGPGEHGNTLPVAVIHRPSQASGPVEIRHAGTHVDGPGEHGNTLPVAVIHRPHGPTPPAGPIHQGTHVDGPGEHGNTLPVAVIHRPHGPSPSAGPVHQGTHVDGPGEHGNTLPVAVIHRPHGPVPPAGPVHQGTHVDGPGEHGNTLPVAVIHRPHGPSPSSSSGPVHQGTHVDGPGEHGNTLPVSVIHRPHGPVPPAGPIHQGTHVDGPGEHGNNLPVAVIHRPHGPTPPAGPVHQGTHVDGPGEHGNNLPVAVIHRPEGHGSSVGLGHQGPLGISGTDSQISSVPHSQGPVHLTGPRIVNTHVDPHGSTGGLQPVPLDHIPNIPPTGPGIHEPVVPLKDHSVGTTGLTGPFNHPTHLRPDGTPISHPIFPAIIAGSTVHGEPTARLAVPTGIPLGTLNVPVVPDRRRRNRILRRRNRLLRRLRNRIPPDGTLLSDILRTSGTVIGKKHHSDGHRHETPSKPLGRGVIVVRRQPAGTSILSALLGSMVPGGAHRSRPVMVRLGHPPPSSQDPLKAIGSRLIGMLVNRIAAG